MIEWMAENVWVVWIGIAVLLAIVEMLSLDLVFLMFALAALSAAVVSGLGGPLWLALLVFGVVALGLLYFARPPMVSRLHQGPTLTTGHHALVGRTAVVAEPVDSFGGRVELAGEIWSARTESSEPLVVGAEVVVTRIDGATAVVSSR
ncbi:NfeD family protein [Aeromicrobium sp. CTD01-1L150]|uniref:NfeD family protein n=1 Tax=Aeromicrobium sp. CTD01-1L150 TaxID=3341830 RepID=UPI0035BF63A7